MFLSFKEYKKTVVFRVMTGIILAAFLSSLPVNARAQLQANFPSGSAVFVPPMIKGITIDPQDPLKFDFLIDVGNDDFRFQSQEDKTAEYRKLIRYFLASLTVPEKDLWVNLSPYEKDRIIPENFGKTEMGRDLLSQDYILKQITASMLHPEKDLGKEFWKKVYQQAEEKFGTIDIPVNTFNKVWIVPDKALVYEKDNTVLLVDSHLKVMLEEDYAALANQKVSAESFAGAKDSASKDVNAIGSQVVREVIIPAIEKEVNEGKDFALLRQINNSLILATWYKTALKESLLGKVYVDRGKTDGVDQEDIADNQRIYEEYVEAFKKGAYNFIKEEVDPVTQEVIPRKYFSGGYTTTLAGSPLSERIKKVSFGPKVKSVIETSSIESVSVNLTETASSAVDNGRRNLLRVAAAGALASLIPDLGSAAQLWVDNLAKIVEVEDGENFESLIDQYFGFDGLLKKLDPAKRAEILETVFKMVKAENPQIKFGSMTDTLPRGLKIRFAEANDYLNFKVYMAFSTVVSQQSVDADGQFQAVYYVMSNIAKDVSPVFGGTAFNFAKYGVVINLAEVKRDLNNFKELRVKVSTTNPGGIEFFLGQAYDRILKGMSDKDILTYLFNDVLGHEIAHGTMRTDFQISSPRSWVGKLMRGQMAGLSRAEIWAYLLQIARSSLPELRFHQLKVMAMSSPSRFASGDVMVPASRILVWHVLDELNYSKYLSDRSIAEEETKQGPMTAQQKEPFIKAAVKSWNDHPEYQISFNKIDLIDEFLATKSRAELREAARKAFLRLTRQERIPQIPADLQPPKEVLDRTAALVASSALIVPIIPQGTFNVMAEMPEVRSAVVDFLADLENPQTSLGVLANRMNRKTPGEPTLDEQTQFLERTGEKAGATGPVVFAPFGGYDPYSPFKIAKGSTDVFAVGGEGFGSPQDIVKFMKAPPDLHASVFDYSKYFTMRYIKDFSGELGIEVGLQAVSIAKIMALLKRAVKGIHYFEIENDGQLRFVNADDMKTGNAAKYQNAVIEFVDADGQTKRFWYMKQYYPNENNMGYLQFINRLKFQTMLIKSVPDQIFDNLDTSVRNQVFKGTIAPAKEHNPDAAVVTDNILRWDAPYPIWQNADVLNRYQLVRGERFGYAVEEPSSMHRGYIFYGKASQLLSSIEEKVSSSAVGGINLDPANLTLQIKRDGKGVALPLPLQDVTNININGFTPVIINITPVPSLPLLIGVNIKEEDRLSSRNQ